MRVTGGVRWAIRQRSACRRLVPIRGASSAAQLAVDSGPDFELPPPPLESVKGKERERVAFTSGASQTSLEQRSFFASDLDIESGTSSASDEGDYRALQPGRVVECRRSGISTLGLILSPIIHHGRPRLLILRSSGDIWPVSPQDVQFLMPPSLIRPELAQQCWSPELVGVFEGSTPGTPAEYETEVMLNARRKAVVTLRKVMRETEKMSGRLSMDGGSMDLVWDHFVPVNAKERGTISAAEVAQHLLNLDRSTPITVKPNTLPAFAAHSLLMNRADLFLADSENMWESGTFLLRSREERRRLARVLRWIDGSAESQAVLEKFLSKARYLIKVRQAGDTVNVPWTADDLDIIHVISLRQYEMRTTQWSPSDKIFIPVLKALGTYPGETVDQGLIPRFLNDIGMLPPHDSLELSKERESLRRRMVGVSKPSTDLLRGDELDALREDFSSQKVYVIDDPGAVELDDGIALETLDNGDSWIHVHVADPTRFLSPNHPIAVDASFKGSATYLPEGNVPLLPLPEVMQKLSLGAEQAGGQSVLTFSALLGPNAEVKESKVRLGWVQKPSIVTYGAVDEALGVPKVAPLKPFGTPPGRSVHSSLPINPDDVGPLQAMRDLAIKYRRRRMAMAGAEYSLPSASIFLVNSPASATNLYDREHLSSRPEYYPEPTIDYTISSFSPVMNSSGMVAEFMILAGRIAAEFLSTRCIPGPFRGVGAVQPMAVPGQPATSLEQVLAARDENGYLDPFKAFAFNLYQPTATLSTAPTPHWVMGFADSDHGYVRATSPLRRYDDLLVHWQIKAALAENRAAQPWKSIPERDMETLMKRSNAAQKKIRRGSKTTNLFWQAGLIKSRLFGPAPLDWTSSDSMVDVRQPILGRATGGTTVEMGTGLTQVYLGSLGLIAAMKSVGSKTYETGQEIPVKITDVVQWPMPKVTVAPV